MAGKNQDDNEFSSLKSVELGIYATSAAYREAIESRGIRISDRASSIMATMEVLPEKSNATLVLCTLAELGCVGPARFEDICWYGEKNGLALCTEEMGVALRLAYAEQPLHETAYIAMNPCVLRMQGPHLLMLRHDRGGRWLYASHCDLDDRWSPGALFVFRQP